MSNKEKITIEDIARHSVAPFTIFDKNGSVLCSKGLILTPKLISMLSLQDLYKTPDKNKKGINGDNITSGLIISRISSETTNFLISTTKSFMQYAEKGKKASIQGCLQARDTILNEVKKHIKSLQHIGELRINYDNYNLSHGINVSTLSTAIGIKLGYSEEQLKELALSALMHDIGKTKIPTQILHKPGALTAKEFEVMKLHAPLGYKILKDEYNLPEIIAGAALDHQEFYDGSGYKRGIEGEKINPYAQVICLADAYDAAASDKCYAIAKAPKDIIKELLQNSKRYNPRILFTLVHMVNYNTGSLKEEIRM